MYLMLTLNMQGGQGYESKWRVEQTRGWPSMPWLLINSPVSIHAGKASIKKFLTNLQPPVCSTLL